MDNALKQLPVGIYYNNKPVIKIDSALDGEIAVRLISKNFDEIANEKGLTFRRKVSNVETAVIFALHWLGQNSEVPVDSFVVGS